MKPIVQITAIALVAFCVIATPCFAQSPALPTLEQRVAALEATVADLFAKQVAPSDADASPLVEASVAQPQPDISVDREKIAKEIIQSAKDSDLSRRQKRKVDRVMTAKRGRLVRVKEQVIDTASSEMFASGVIVATPEGVEAAVNWDAIATFIERMLPIFLQIMSFFNTGLLQSALAA